MRTSTLVATGYGQPRKREARRGPWLSATTTLITPACPDCATTSCILHASRAGEAPQPLAAHIVVGGAMDAGVVVEALVHGGVGEATRAHLRERLVFVSTHAAPVVEEAAPLEDRQGALAALHAWLQDWSDTARVVVTRRDLLIRLGLAKRRGRAPKAVAAPPRRWPRPPPRRPRRPRR